MAVLSLTAVTDLQFYKTLTNYLEYTSGTSKMADCREKIADVLPDLDDLLQCPVCYEIPSGQIFQCNEGHHVCGSCKARLNLCPVCRSMFFGTRNYAMEELIANVRKFQASRAGSTVAKEPEGSPASSSVTSSARPESVSQDSASPTLPEQQALINRAPMPCKGLFRCLCCKEGDPVRLPSGRLLNHLRYFHSSDLVEGKSENGQYLQAWQIATVPARTVIALRVADLGQFFIVIEIERKLICAWMAMAATAWMCQDYCYTITLAGIDREAYFSDAVVSVKSCEGTLKRRNNCLLVRGNDARAMTSTPTVNVRVAVRRDNGAGSGPPRAVLRVANPGEGTLEPLIQGLQEDVERLTRAFTTLGRNMRTDIQADIESLLEAPSMPVRRVGSAPGTAPPVSNRVTPLRTAPALSVEEVRNPWLNLTPRMLQSLNEPLVNGGVPNAARGRSSRRRHRQRR